MTGLQCEEVSLSNGQINCANSNFFGSKCSFKCNDGYKITGKSVSKCFYDENGAVNWDIDAPVCTGYYT